MNKLHDIVEFCDNVVRADVVATKIGIIRFFYSFFFLPSTYFQIWGRPKDWSKAEGHSPQGGENLPPLPHISS